MTTGSGDEPTADSWSSATEFGRSTTAGTVLKTAGLYIRRDPVLAVPFGVVGLLVALADWLRTQDPLSVAQPDSFEQTLSVQYSIFPTGTARTVRHADALVDLRVSYLLGAVALELLVPLAVGLAGWLTITRALDSARRPRSLVRYLGVLLAVIVLPWILGAPTIDVENVLLGTVALLAAALVLVRLFLLPGLLAAGRPFLTALRESVRVSQGSQWPLFWLIVTVGLTSWGLAQVPIAGGFLSTAVVAPVHAVSLAVLLRDDPDDDHAADWPQAS